jgi:hypothetical protein
MINKKYALLVENEIFDIFSVTNDPGSEILTRWELGFSGQPFGMEITGMTGVTVGSIWTGEGFDNSEVSPDYVSPFDETRKLYAILNNNKIFMLIDPADNYPKVQEMYSAAFSTNTIVGMDITDFPNEVTYEWVWNGKSFSPPESL